MKTFLLTGLLFSAIGAFSQEAGKNQNFRLGLLFNYGTPKQDRIDFLSAARLTLPIYKDKVYIGTEINYTMRYGKALNADFAGGILFTRIKPYLGFIGELGYSYNQMVTGRRHDVKTYGLFLSLGYEVKLNDRWSIDFQYRVLPAKYLENDIINSKVFLLGTSFMIYRKQRNAK